MIDRRQLRRVEEADKERSPGPGREPRKSAEAASILDLQGSAGNRAVAQLLESRNADPTLAPLQRQPSGWRPGSESANDGRMTIPDMKLTMPIRSFSHQDGGARDTKDQSGVVNVTIAFGSHDAEIAEAAAKGRQFDTITIALGARQTFTLHSVIISGYTSANEVTGLSLSFTSMELKLAE